jgi:hypothetical protein
LDVAEIQGLYADLDAGDFPGGSDEIDCHLSEIIPSPTLIADSGSGRHAYWLFRLPAALETGEPGAAASRRAEVREALTALADALGVPPERNTVHDLARVLRLPGTLNVKAKYGQPLPCLVLAAEPQRRYDPSAFAALIAQARRRWPEAGAEDGEGQAVEFAQGSPWYAAGADELLAGLRLPPSTLGRLRAGAPEGGRSEADLRAAMALLASGASPERIRAIFACPELGVGAKYREKAVQHGAREADRYLARTIGRAQGFLTARNPAGGGRAEGRTCGGT